MAMFLGELLVNANVISRAQLDEALRLQRVKGGRIGDVLVDHFGVDHNAIVDARLEQVLDPEESATA